MDWERNRGLFVGFFLIIFGAACLIWINAGVGGFLVGLGGFKLLSETRK